MCRAFKEFNYLLQIDPNMLTKNIKGFKTYDDYKDDWIYEWNEDVPWAHERPWTDNGVWEEPTPVTHHFGNTLRYQNLEWYKALKDTKLKEEALKNKAIMKGIIDEDDESSNEVNEDEEYAAIKENKYDDLMSTSEEACRAYKKSFSK
ncbi:hypothetical protein Tco_1489400 [Tanacetum coccineum]